MFNLKQKLILFASFMLLAGCSQAFYGISSIEGDNKLVYRDGVGVQISEKARTSVAFHIPENQAEGELMGIRISVKNDSNRPINVTLGNIVADVNGYPIQVLDEVSYERIITKPSGFLKAMAVLSSIVTASATVDALSKGSDSSDWVDLYFADAILEDDLAAIDQDQAAKQEYAEENLKQYFKRSTISPGKASQGLVFFNISEFAVGDTYRVRVNVGSDVHVASFRIAVEL